MNSIALNLVPANPVASRRRDGAFTVYDVAFDEIELAIAPFPADLAFGLYRLTIETPDAARAAFAAFLSVERAGERERMRVTIEAGIDRIHLFFVVLGDERHPVLHLVAEDVPAVRLGEASLRRVSTTLWRTNRSLRWLQRRVVRPSVLAEDARSLRRGFQEGGMAEIRRRALDAINPSMWTERRQQERRMSRFVRRISVQNRKLLAEMGLAEMGPMAAPDHASLTIVVPIFRTPKAWLAQLVTSLNQQTEQSFEVVFVFDGPQPDLADEVGTLIGGGYAHRLVTLPANRGVAAATNAGIREATGDFVVVVDHDDILERHLVETFHRASAALPADIYFADEAITDEGMQMVRAVASRGRFDIRHYLSHPYIVHPIFIRRAIAEEAGLFDESLRVSHDVDFFLRCVARARTVVQIPLLLYFWRTHDKSLGHAAMDAVLANTTAAVRSYLEARMDWASFEVRPGINFNELDVRPPLPSDPRVAIVIPTKNGHAILKQCLDSIHDRASANRVPADIYVVDHESDDPATLRYLEAERASGRIGTVHHVGPWNYSAINNAAIRQILLWDSYSHIVLMNNDIELVTDDWLDRMVAQFSWGDVGVVGCCLVYPDGRVQHGGVVVGLVGAADHSHRFEELLQYADGPRAPGYLSSLVATRDYSAVTAALLAVPVALFEAVGGLDEKLAIGFNDTDLCLRIGELGYKSTYVGGVVAVHHESITRKSSGGVDHPDDTTLFCTRYKEILEEGDPCYGAQMDWTMTLIRLSEVPQKAFKLREATLPSSPGGGSPGGGPAAESS